MPIKVVELTRYEKIGDVVELAWEIGGVAYTRTVTAAKIDTLEKLAAWLRDQHERPLEPAPVQPGRYTVTIGEDGQITAIEQDQQVDNLLAQIATRKTQITTDLAALPAATTAEVKAIIGRQLNAETQILTALGGMLRFLRRLA